MCNMYKEIISRRKLFSMIKLFIMLIAILFLEQFVKSVNMINNRTGIMSFIYIIIIAIIVLEIFRCRVKYSYCIIASQLVIHKIKGDEHEVVENIKIKDIKNIIEKKFVFSNNKIHSCNKYIMNIFKLKTYCCVYNDGKKLKRFYFDPSNNFIEKVKFNRNKKCVTME